MGLLLTDLRADFAITRLTAARAGGARRHRGEASRRWTRRRTTWFAQEGIAAGARRLTRTVDMRYAGQNYELPIALPDGPITPATLDALAEGFAAAHHRMYGFIAEGEPVQLVTFRVEATGLVSQGRVRSRSRTPGPMPSRARSRARDVWLAEAGGFVACPGL